MSNLRETYDMLSKYYMREARSCFDSLAYRMTIVSAATAVHVGLYYRLLLDKEYDQEERMDTFNNIWKKLDENTKYSKVSSDVKWLMNARNAIAHPEESLTIEPKIDSTGAFSQIKEKIPNTTDVKKMVFTSSMIHDLNALKKIAEDALKKAENILCDSGFVTEIGNVNYWKLVTEKQLSQILGREIDRNPQS